MEPCWCDPLEHIAGGYQKTLAEIRRVLKPGGLFFVHPGLYYSIDGNHLAEFFDDPFIHLKIPETELKQKVLGSQPRRMERAGHRAEPAEYWQWYKELNKITTQKIEQELREIGFEPWRVGLRTANVVEYTAELQKYNMADLAIKEMYASFILNK
jgi:SAM-dependent methyltransferase